MIKSVCLYCSRRCPLLGNIGDIISSHIYIIDVSGTMGALLLDVTSNLSCIVIVENGIRVLLIPYLIIQLLLIITHVSNQKQ